MFDGGACVGVGVLVAVGVAVAVAAGVDVGVAVDVRVAVAVGTVVFTDSAAKMVKCIDCAVTVWLATLTVDPLNSCQLIPSKKNRPAGGVPVNPSVIWTGCRS